MLLVSPSQLDCCGPTGTVIDAAKDICPKKEGLEVLITTVTNVTRPRDRDAWQKHFLLSFMF